MIRSAIRLAIVSAAEKFGWLTSVDGRIIADYLRFYNINAAEVRGTAAEPDAYYKGSRVYRRYLVSLVSDALVSASIGMFLFLEEVLAKWLVSDEWVAGVGTGFTASFYGFVAISVFVVLTVLSTIDLYRLHYRSRPSMRAPNPEPEADT